MNVCGTEIILYFASSTLCVSGICGSCYPLTTTLGITEHGVTSVHNVLWLGANWGFAGFSLISGDQLAKIW